MAAQAAVAEVKKQHDLAKKNSFWTLIWSVFQHVGILVVLVIVAILGYNMSLTEHGHRLHLHWMHWNTGHRTVVRHDVVQKANTAGRFFLDIVMSHDALKGSLGGLHMEKKGWSGVCVAPGVSRSHVHNRTCSIIAAAVGATDGKTIQVPDCGHSLFGLKDIYQNFASKFTGNAPAVQCSHVTATTVSIAKVLVLAAAPKVVDYIALDTQGTELAIINSFPFDKHCVHAWEIAAKEDTAIIGLTQVLQDQRGCNVKSSGDQVWARCSCNGFSNRLSRLLHTPRRPSAKPSAIEILPSGQASMAKTRHRGASDSDASVLSVDD